MEEEELDYVGLTKRQWEEIYQWYLICKDDYNLESYQSEIGQKVSSMLIAKYGTFK